MGLEGFLGAFTFVEDGGVQGDLHGGVLYSSVKRGGVISEVSLAVGDGVLGEVSLVLGDGVPGVVY